MSAGSKKSDGLDEGTCAVMETTMLEEGFFAPSTGSGGGVNDVGNKKQLESLCRVCANTSDYFIPIFEGEGLEHQLDMKIQKHLPIQVLEVDNLPAHVCYQCASTLIAWHDLVTACVEADKKLHRLLQEEADEEFGGDHDEKVVEFFNEPPVDSDGADDFSEPSTSAVVAELKESLPPQKRKPAGKGKRKVYESASSERDAKVNTVPADSKDACTGQKEGVESASSTERSKQCVLLKIEHLAEQDIAPKSGVRNTDKPERPFFECDFCGKRLLWREKLKAHLRIHSGERPFTCHVCGKQFREPLCMKRHVKEVHDRVRDCICDLCGNKFANRRTRDDHRRIHTGERPFICDACGKTFKTKASLFVHKKHHTDTFPHTCVHCGKRFRMRSNLACHLTTHTGEKHHFCDICGQSFGLKHTLTSHKRIHLSDKSHFCVVCGKGFAQKRYLKNHEKRHKSQKQNYVIITTKVL